MKKSVFATYILTFILRLFFFLLLSFRQLTRKCSPTLLKQIENCIMHTISHFYCQQTKIPFFVVTHAAHNFLIANSFVLFFCSSNKCFHQFYYVNLQHFAFTECIVYSRECFTAFVDIYLFRMHTKTPKRPYSVHSHIFLHSF